MAPASSASMPPSHATAPMEFAKLPLMLPVLTHIFRIKPKPYGVSIMADSRSPGTLTLECVQDKLEELRGTLPRPIPDTPYGREVRDEIARGMFLALHPADVLDATFACQIILLNAHADDSLRLPARQCTIQNSHAAPASACLNPPAWPPPRAPRRSSAVSWMD
jgi:hypothetical protein